jgi:hypothetical protein
VINKEVLTREQFLDKLVEVLEIHERVSSFVCERLFDQCRTTEHGWAQNREKIVEYLKGLVTDYAFVKILPRNELAISSLAVLNFIVKIQHTFLQLLIMIDMLRSESFDDVYLNSMNSISLLTHQQLTTLKKLTLEQKGNPDAAYNSMKKIEKLERQIDEDYIVIGRMISVSTNGETGYTPFIMRKIVRELEQISDFIKRAAEIIVGI